MVTRPEARHCQPSLGSAARSHNLLGGQAPAYVPGLAHKDTSELHGLPTCGQARRGCPALATGKLLAVGMVRVRSRH